MGFAEKCFEFRESLLDGIEIGRIGRQEKQLGAGLANDAPHVDTFVAGEIVHDDNVALAQCRGEDLRDIGTKARAIDWTVDDARGGETIGT